MKLNNITTERIILSSVIRDDAKDIWEIWSNSENERYMSDPVESLESVMDICHSVEKDDGSDGYLTVAICKDTGEVMGTCTFGPTSKKDEWGLGYSIKQKYWGQGYATEIVKSVIQYGQSAGIKSFVASCAIENIGSGKVLEKSGMKKDRRSSFKQPKLNIVYESQVYKLHVED